MKRFLACFEKTGQITFRKPLKQTVEILSDDHVTLSQVTEYFEKETGQRVGEMNAFGATLVEIIEKDTGGEIIINENTLTH
ncbi:hypothetical protein B9J93_23095 [Vibrio sp. V17_P4S1T151]|uniref:hypothetical protein n=1 Tax=unclassified Vibrio TaxID=2614977 RepID=UPI000B8E4BE0|nr:MULTISPECIES: hypothetical protein [unclassified Vibrio]OXX39994.1 hypothetical protein B9J93_23095 [Vibrio sp. V17_P4S1T151]OXX64530.1 hypothetical protein B9J89_01160 [Vibrio sp. V15_P4S5T153]